MSHSDASDVFVEPFDDGKPVTINYEINKPIENYRVAADNAPRDKNISADITRKSSSRFSVVFYYSTQGFQLKMKLFVIALSMLSLATAKVFVPDEWTQVKSALDSPRHQLIINKIFPRSSFSMKTYRSGRIAGGELARMGQFVHQALLLTRDGPGNEYVCGGAIISHNWILTVSHD